MPEKKDPAGIIPDWFNRDMDFDGDCDLLDMTLYEDQFREEEEETPSYLEDEEDELEDDDALMERLSEMDETEREFFLMDHPTIQQRIEDDFELEEFMSELDTESENDDFYDEDDEFEDDDFDESDEFDEDEGENDCPVVDLSDSGYRPVLADLEAAITATNRIHNSSGRINHDAIRERRREARTRLENSLADEKDIALCKFVLEDKATAARYLTTWKEFLYAQAIKDHFELPFSIPDEISSVKTNLYTLMKDLILVDVHKAIAIWNWCLDTFFPYLSYVREPDNLTNSVLLAFGENYGDELIDHASQHTEFLERVIRYAAEPPNYVDNLVICALKKGKIDMAKQILEYAFANSTVSVHKKIDYIFGCISTCSIDGLPKELKLFREHLFPIVHTQTDVRIVNHISIWKERMDEIEEEYEEESEDDLYTGKNAWREKYRENPITWLVDPVDYDDEQEYLEASQERKYAWRKGLSNPFGILPENFETRTEYEAALSEAYRNEREEREEKRRKMMHVEDTTLYKFCKISTNYPLKPHYYYLTGDLNVKVGDLVAVPLGYKNAETLGVVVSVGQCYSFSFPCALDQMKTVIRIEETSPHE